jgi:hypothetical protein
VLGARLDGAGEADGERRPLEDAEEASRLGDTGRGSVCRTDVGMRVRPAD